MTKNIKDKLYFSAMAEDAYELARKYNVGVEVNALCVSTVLDDFSSTKHAIKADMAGINRFTAHGIFNDLIPAAMDPEIRKVVMNRFNAVFHAVTELEIHRVVFHSGWFPNTYFPEIWVENSKRFWSEFMSDKPPDFNIMIENAYDFGPDLLCRLIDVLDDARIKICLDLGHINTFSKTTLPNWIHTLGDRIGHVHMHSNDADGDKHWAFAKGTVDIKYALDAISECAPNATFCIETRDNVSESIQWLVRDGYLIL